MTVSIFSKCSCWFLGLFPLKIMPKKKKGNQRMLFTKNLVLGEGEGGES